MTKPVVFVIGATGNVGASAVSVLSAKYQDKVEIRAGVRDTEKADKIKSLPGVTLVQATMGDEKLEQTLTGVDTLLINTPSTENRSQLVTSTAELAKKAGVKHIVVVSVTAADSDNVAHTILGQHFHTIEENAIKLGVPYTFIRLPFFLENLFGFKDTIVGQDAIFAPIGPDKPFLEVAAVEDGGSASAAILANPSQYTNKAVTIISGYQTFEEVAQDFSTALGKEIKYVQVPYEAARKAFQEQGVPEWQVNGSLEYYKLIDSSDQAITTSEHDGTFTQITGEEPTTLKKWLAKYTSTFQ